jgi:hypothetical protein
MTDSIRKIKALGATAIGTAFLLGGLVMCESKEIANNNALQERDKTLNTIFQESFREYNIGTNAEGVVDTVYAIPASKLRAAGFTYGQ